MDINYIQRINFQCRELMVDRLIKNDKKQCYLELFKHLHKNGAPYVKDSGVFFTLNEREQSVVYKLHEIITKYT